MKKVLRVTLIGSAFLMAGCAGGFGGSPEPIEPPAVRYRGVDYEVTFTGVEERQLRRDLDAASQLVGLRDRPPATEAALRRRAEEDLPRLKELLVSLGYYDAALDYRVEPREQDGFLVTVAVRPGPRYAVSRFVAFTPEGQPIPLDLDLLEIDLRGPAAAAAVVESEREVLRALGGHGYPLARVVERDVVVDRAAKTMEVTLTIDPGPLARFGAVTVSGLDRVEESFVRRRIEWEPGAIFDADKIEETREALAETRLFASLRIQPGDAVDAEGRLPVAIALVEAKPRSVGVGIDYATDLGPGVSAFWEHRNFFGAGEELRVDTTVSSAEQTFSTGYREPDFLQRDLALLAEVQVSAEQREAFDSRRVGASIGLERPVSDVATVAAGVALERSRVTDETRGADRARTENFTLFSVPLRYSRDTTESLLNPISGNRLTVFATPYVEALGSNVSFFSARVVDSHYLPLLRDPETVLAGWVGLGGIFGAALDDIPADKRFYAGGGGSVRGYEFQFAGPLDANNDPTGGLSLLEFGTEIRFRVSENIGLAPFIEAGTVYPESVPDFGNRLFWGVGIGARYYTDIGPVRADVAFPLNRRPNVDDRFQIYVSLGQAF